ncbi:MAG: hypothetical protein ACRCZU_03950 [Selenomonadaceae bacterium]
MIIVKCSKAEQLFHLQHFPNIFIELGLLAQHSPPPERTKFDTAMSQSIVLQLGKNSGDSAKPVLFYDDHAAVTCEQKWAEMQQQYKEYFRKHGYIPVRFNAVKADFEVVVPSVGRPIASKPKHIVKNIRLDDAMNQMLDDYCITNKVGASEAVRRALQKFFVEKK